MEASDLCLIIDNTQAYLREWLGLARHERKFRLSLTAVRAEGFFRSRMLAGRSMAFGVTLRRDVIHLICDRIDWDEVADHYNTKVSEGASVPDATYNSSGESYADGGSY